MAYNQRFNGKNGNNGKNRNNQNNQNNQKYDPEATASLLRLVRSRDYRNAQKKEGTKKLIREGADPHSLLTIPYSIYDNIIIAFAANGDADFLQELFAMDIEPTSRMLESVIMNFGNMGRKEDNDEILRVVEAILNANPDLVNANIEPRRKPSTTPLILAIERDGFPYTLTRLLLERGADPDLQDGKGRTALIVASTRFDIDDGEEEDGLIKTLLKYGADMELQNKKGLSAQNYMRKEGGYRKTHHKRKTRHHKRKNHKTSKRR